MINMIRRTAISIALAGTTITAFAAEECPVSKISLARGLACEVYQLAHQSTDADSKLDAICLKLGRVSAIMRRTQGQLPNRPTTPVPPKDWKQQAIEIEGFCGLGSDVSLPRGLTNPEVITRDEAGLKSYLKARLQEFNPWVKENKDPVEANCPAPTPIPESLLELCGTL